MPRDGSQVRWFLKSAAADFEKAFADFNVKSVVLPDGEKYKNLDKSHNFYMIDMNLESIRPTNLRIVF